MPSPRNNNPEEKRAHKGTITEIKKSEVEGEVVTQEFLAHLSQTRADSTALMEEFRAGKHKIRLALARGATVEPGPLRVVRKSGGRIDIV